MVFFDKTSKYPISRTHFVPHIQEMRNIFKLLPPALKDRLGLATPVVLESLVRQCFAQPGLASRKPEEAAKLVACEFGLPSFQQLNLGPEPAILSEIIRHYHFPLSFGIFSKIIFQNGFHCISGSILPFYIFIPTVLSVFKALQILSEMA